MNNIEFEQVLKVTGINKIVGTCNGYESNIILDSEIVKRNVYEFNNIKFYYPGIKRVFVYGNIPNEVLELMISKCSNSFDEVYQSNKYVIHTKECLLLFILAVKDYYLSKQEKNATEVSRYKELVTIVNDNLIKLANPNVDSDEWINCIGIYDDYRKGRDKWNKSSIGRNFLSAIEDFDNVINSLSNEDIDMDKVNELMVQGKIKVETIISDKRYMYENYCKIEIYSEDNKSHVCYERSAEGFDYFLVYNSNVGSMCFYHRYNYDSYDHKENEVIFCRHDVYGVEKRIEYSLTNDKLYCNKDLDVESFGILYDELLIAIERAKEITYDRLLKNDDKTLTKK